MVSYKGETVEFDIFIITQIVYVIIIFKSIISTFTRAHTVHISTPTSLKCLGVIMGVLFVSKLINI